VFPNQARPCRGSRQSWLVREQIFRKLPVQKSSRIQSSNVANDNHDHPETVFSTGRAFPF